MVPETQGSWIVNFANYPDAEGFGIKSEQASQFNHNEGFYAAISDTKGTAVSDYDSASFSTGIDSNYLPSVAVPGDLIKIPGCFGMQWCEPRLRTRHRER